MYTSVNDFKLNNIAIGQYIQTIKMSFNDTWSSNTGYNLANEFMGEFKGTIPKFTLKFRPLKTSEIQYLYSNIFRNPIMTCTYKDPQRGLINISVHKGDVEQEWINIDKSKEFTFEVVGNRPI